MYFLELLDYCISQPKKYRQIICDIREQNIGGINTIQSLKKKYHDAPITELLHLYSIQQKAQKKLPFAMRWFFTEKSYQQASTFHLAKYHGSLFDEFHTVADLCCGIGSDLLMLSRKKTKCYAVDIDKNLLRLAENNMSFFHRKNIEYLDICAENFHHKCEAVFIDPDRRKHNRKMCKVEDISPNFSTIQKLIKKYANVAVKLSPIMDYEQNVFDDYSFDFVSENGEMKECLLKSGRLKTSRRAVLLPHLTIFSEKGHPQTAISQIDRWVYEPDSAIIRSHLVNDLAYEMKMRRIDQHIALLTSEIEPVETYGRKYRVIEVFDYNLTRLNSYLRSGGIGIVDIKTKGFSESVETFRKKLRLSGKAKVVIFIVRIGESHICIVCGA
jgi:hypothetical protein